MCVSRDCSVLCVMFQQQNTTVSIECAACSPDAYRLVDGSGDMVTGPLKNTRTLPVHLMLFCPCVFS